MKPNQVQAVCLRDADDPFPRFHIRRRVAGLGENAALEGATDEGLAAIQHELRALGPQLAQAEDYVLVVEDGPVVRLFHEQAERIKMGQEFVPKINDGAT